MIKRLRIKNFQKHVDFKLKLEPVTTIIGPTDSGKSSLIRALKWILLNKPRGESFLHWDAENVTVTVTVKGHKVRRGRGKKGNLYHLDGGKFAAFGNNVPEEIASVLNVTELNFQGQHDASGFWFSLTPGEVSRRLNQIVDLGTIDTTLSYLANGLRKSSAEVRVIEARLASVQSEHDTLKRVKKEDRALQRVERAQQEFGVAVQESNLLELLLEKVQGCLTVLDRLGRRLSRGQKAIKLGEKWEGYEKQRAKLQVRLVSVKRQTDIATTIVPNIKRLEKRHVAHVEAETERSQLAFLIQETKRWQTCSDVGEHNVRHAEKDLKETMGEVCPLCDQPISQTS